MCCGVLRVNKILILISIIDNFLLKDIFLIHYNETVLQEEDLLGDLSASRILFTNYLLCAVKIIKKQEVFN